MRAATLAAAKSQVCWPGAVLIAEFRYASE